MTKQKKRTIRRLLNEKTSKSLAEEISADNQNLLPENIKYHDGILRDNWGVPMLSKEARKTKMSSETPTLIRTRSKEWSDEIRSRLNECRELISKGQPSAVIASSLSEKWEVSEATVSVYITRAKEEIQAERDRVEQVKKLLVMFYPRNRIIDVLNREWAYLTEHACQIHSVSSYDENCPNCNLRIENLREYVLAAIEVAEEELRETSSPHSQLEIAAQAWGDKFRQAEADYQRWKGRENKLIAAIEELEIKVAIEADKLDDLEIEDKKEKAKASKPLKKLKSGLYQLQEKLSSTRYNRIESEGRWKEYRIRLDKIMKLESMSGSSNVNIDNRTQTVLTGPTQINVPQPTIGSEIQNVLADEPRRLTVGEPFNNKDIDDELAEILNDPEVKDTMKKYLQEEQIIDVPFEPKENEDVEGV